MLFSLLLGLGSSIRELEDPGAGEEADGKVGLLATRVRGECIPAGLEKPG